MCYEDEQAIEIELLPDPEKVIREMVISRVKQRHAELRKLRKEAEQLKSSYSSAMMDIQDRENAMEIERNGLLKWLSSQNWISTEDLSSLRERGREVGGVGFFGEKED